MDSKWLNDLIGLLKHLEKTYPNLNKIHKFRRSVESTTNHKKLDKLLPQLSVIYDYCKGHLDDPDFISWVNEQEFQLKNGMRTVTLVDNNSPQMFEQHFRWALSYFDPQLDQRPPSQEEKR